ncbi:hypothetical protein IEU95_02325 [Hoyosella rhizosphaerae]|uniref:DUF6542 domain-containing protein n=1 Tax=Hoyosella rhizosphaerae TaxID=1755582 RepID=A0A916XGJ7_9ACTN|nr:DUF6542 domain-containing protein [Hoyosella rhizosphaerae]MBN4925651.1 hypothetical protein [Hoyosella rhizosphaerae]GGC68968.1 hypothetical protein GCM10011410_22240 [Hoyosella rhizosphaerae]
MPESRPAPVSVPPELRSVSPRRVGAPWWGAILIAVGVSVIGFLFDAMRGDELTMVFSAFYFLGCVAAVLAVQQRALFTAMAQPPLLLFAAIPLGYQLIVPESPGGLRTRIIDLVLPLVTSFPLMLFTAAVVVVIGGVRLFTASKDDNSTPRRVNRPTSQQRTMGTPPAEQRPRPPQA